MGTTSWRGQIDRALRAIDHIGHSKYAAKQAQGWQPGEAVAGLFSHGYRNTVFDRAVTFTNWLREEYPAVQLFRDVDYEMTADLLRDFAAVLECGPQSNSSGCRRADFVDQIDQGLLADSQQSCL
jgi:hypothetical protein